LLESIEDMYIDGVSMAETFTDKDDEFNDYLIVNSVYGRGVLERDNTLLPTLAMDGAYPSYSRFPVRELTVEITVKAPSFDELRKKVERLSKFVNSSKEVEISFADEMDRRYYGRLGMVDGDLETNRIMKTTLTFECSDPFKYGDTRVIERPDGALPVYNNGYDSYPIIELEAKQKTTFAMISDGSNYNIAGTLTDVEQEVVDTRNVIIDELGDTLGEWRDISTQGAFKSDSNGIFVNSYGTGTGWHGPRIEKELPSVDNFEIEIYMNVRTEQDKMTFRTSLNFYDDEMKELGMLRLWDKNNKRTAKIVEGRIGKYTGTNYENYMISDKNYFWEGQRVYNGIIRVTRVGNEWTFYAAHITQRGNHIETITRKYNDVNGEFSNALRYIRAESSVYGDNPPPNALRIQRIRVTELAQITEDQTPYILEPGDVLTFDHVSRNILVNGEPRLDLKNFGGTWFPLKEGQQTIVVSPEDAFDATLTFEERFI